MASPALFEAAELRGTGLAGLRSQLTAVQVLLADLAAQVGQVSAEGLPDPAESPDELLAVAQQAHTVMNQAAAVRASAVARFARWSPETDHVAARRRPRQLGHYDRWAADTLAPQLGLGTYEAQSVVQEAAWMASRTPRLLAAVGEGSANAATVAAIARELQDARPDSCEHVEEAALRRKLHQRPRSVARRSARLLVSAVEAAAARRTATRTLAQQTGVWLDAHPTPGLSLLSAALPTAQAEALMTAVDDAAHRSSVRSSDERTAGQHRADALLEMSLRNVRFTAHLEYVVPPGQNGPSDVLLGRSGAVPATSVQALLATHGHWVTSSVMSAPDDTAAHDTADEGADRYRPSAGLREAVQRRDRRCRFPGCARPAPYTDLDHVIAWPLGRTTAANLQCLCRRHHRAKHARWTVEMNTAGVCTWTDPDGRTATTEPARQEDVADLATLRHPPAEGEPAVSSPPTPDRTPAPSRAAPG